MHRSLGECVHSILIAECCDDTENKSEGGGEERYSILHNSDTEKEDTHGVGNSVKALSVVVGVEILFTNGSDEILNFAFMAFCDEAHPAAFADIGGTIPVLRALAIGIRMHLIILTSR